MDFKLILFAVIMIPAGIITLVGIMMLYVFSPGKCSACGKKDPHAGYGDAPEKNLCYDCWMLQRYNKEKFNKLKHGG